MSLKRLKRALFLAQLALCLSLAANPPWNYQENITLSDSGHLYKARIEQYYQPDTVEALQEILHYASTNKKTISFAGQRHSQGGHSFCEKGIVIDMRSLNRILKIDPVEKVIVVQAGVTWEEIQDAINPYKLAIKIMQASNIFTVGGSLSVNAHGRDPSYGTLIESVHSIKVLKADGTIVCASRKENGDLFRAVIGGYGLFGAIIEAEIELTDNVVYQSSGQVVAIEDYPAYVQKHILGQPQIGLHFARVNISSNNFLREAIAVSYIQDNKALCDEALKPESKIAWNKTRLFFLRHFDVVKDLRWPIEVRLESKPQILTRNQAMRPPVKCLSYNSKFNTDILQEYFIPVDQFGKFAEALRVIALIENINLLNVTIRYVPRDTLSLLPYAKENCFAFVLYVTLPLKEQEKAQQWTQRLIDEALACRGTYYLPYQLYATQEQLRKAYPEVDSLVEAKRVFDPQGIFSNTFYQVYFQREK